MQNTTIEWSDKVWNPVTGCTKVSQGCKNCYAEAFYERFNGKGSFKNIICHEDRLLQPVFWKKPSMIFVNSMSDLFHEQVPFEFIDRVYEIMSDAIWHTYQILTKRSAHMVEYYQWKSQGGGTKFNRWPLLNVWVGVSVEDQKAAEERIFDLFDVPAAVRWLSCEPLLGPLNFDFIIDHPNTVGYVDKIDWLVVGGESGIGARRVNKEWILSIKEQSKKLEAAFFFKQWGAFNEESKRVGKKKSGRLLDGILYNEYPKQAR